jgi:CheY-like chemotaxis protein
MVQLELNRKHASNLVADSTMGLKVLIVEDDPISLELMSEVLASLEAEVQPISAASTPQA